MARNPFRTRRDQRVRAVADAAVAEAIDQLRQVLTRPITIKIEGKTVATVKRDEPVSDNPADYWGAYRSSST